LGRWMKKILFMLLLPLSFVWANLEFGFDESSSEEEYCFDFEDEFSDEPVFDPLEGYNRVMTRFNDKFYLYLLNPITDGYKFITPQEFRDRVRDFFTNLNFPVRLVNNLLQGKFNNAVEEIGRFFVNTTFGLGGLFDAASAQGIPRHDEDFGQTLGYYGVGNGFHIVLPILGPINVRDIGGRVFDYFLSPLHHNNEVCTIANNSEEALYLNVAKAINDYSYDVDNYELLRANAVDLYPFMRDMYEAQRDEAIAK